MAKEPMIAPKGKIYKRGNDYGYQVHVGVSDDPNEWKLVDEAEYKAYKESEQAEAADYEAALSRLGVK